MIISGIIFSALFTMALTTCTRRAIPNSKSPSDEPARSDATKNLDLPPPTTDRKTGFHPYSGWIAWLYDSPARTENWQKSPLSTGLALSDTEQLENRSPFPSYLTKGSRARIGLEEPLITAPADTHSLKDLEAQIQTDLANLQRHQLLLAKLAERQAPTSVSKSSQVPRWLQEEQKRSAKHLLLARNSLEKIARRYSEWTHLTTAHQVADASSTAPKPMRETASSINLLVRSVKIQSLLAKAGWTSSEIFRSNALALSPFPTTSALSFQFQDPLVWDISTPLRSALSPPFAQEHAIKLNQLERP